VGLGFTLKQFFKDIELILVVHGAYCTRSFQGDAFISSLFP